MTVSGTAIGHETDRIDGSQKVRGTATYAAEYALTGLLHAALVRSTIAHGRIRSVDGNGALQLPGVVGVYVHGDLESLEPLEPGGTVGDWRMPLCDDVVHYVGQNVAVVVAETSEAAREAADLVRVTYDPLEPTLLAGRDYASLAQAAVVARGHEGGSDHDRGDLDSALATPEATVVDEVYTTADLTHSPMEPSATIATWANGMLTLHESTQGVQSDQGFLATAFGLDPADVQVIAPFVGGAFGCKGAIWPHTLLAASVARKLDRAVRLVLTRPQMFDGVGGRPGTVQRVRLAARRDGTLLGIGHDSINPTAVTTDWLESCTRSTSVTLYACEHVRTTQRVVRAHINPPTFMRAPGETPGTFALESAMDELAVALDIDPVELRLRNYADRSPDTGQPWSGKELRACYERGAEHFGWSGRSAEPRSMREGDDLVGWGMATAVFPGIRQPAAAKVRISRDGRVRVQTATHEIGTGAATACAIIAADGLGVDVDRVDVEVGHSSLPASPLAGGSSSTASFGEAVAGAARAVRAQLLALAAADPESPLAGLEPDDVHAVDGHLIERSNPDRTMRFEDILEAAGEDQVEAKVDTQLSAEMTATYAMQTHGAHFCEVRIDPLDPRIRVTRVVSVMDIGRVINPRAARSQVIGSVIMGMGMALGEHTVRDARTGGVVAGNLADYVVPVNADIGSIEVEFIDIPDRRIGSLGARGPGEVGTTGITAAIANAVHHATGRRVRSLPMTPDLLLD